MNMPLHTLGWIKNIIPRIQDGFFTKISQELYIIFICAKHCDIMLDGKKWTAILFTEILDIHIYL